MTRQRILIATLLTAATTLSADVRVNINLGVGHPLARPARTVIVRRPAPVVRTKVVYVQPVVWRSAIVVAPPRERMVWEDRETFRRQEDWVDTHFTVNSRGDALYFRVDGRVQIDFAEVTFANGQVQVVDFNEAAAMGAGTYRLLDFTDGRQVEYVRMVARSRTPQSTIAVLMKK